MKEAIELLRKVYQEFSDYGRISSPGSDRFVHNQQLKNDLLKRLNQALTLLKNQPEAEEFTKHLKHEAGVLWESLQGRDWNKEKIYGHKLFVWVQVLEGTRRACDRLNAAEAKNDRQAEENKKLLTYIKRLHAQGICSTMAIVKWCGLSYREVLAWGKESKVKDG